MTDTRIALVTGTSSGMGLWTAVGLASAGLHVIATLRNPDRADALRASAAAAEVSLDIRALDVTDRPGAVAVVDAVAAEFGRLDVLINNAGIGAVGTLEQLDDAALQAQLDVNYLGVAAVTRAALPHMRAARSGRIVTVTSVGGTVGQPFADAYCGAKFAVEGLMQSLAPVAATFGIEVSIVEPAAVASEFVANAGAARLEPDPADPYGDLLAAYLRRTAGAFANAQSAKDAASVIIEAATTERPKFRWQTSPSAVAFAGMSLADLDGSRVLSQTTTWLA